jgi:hypothetical protein
MVVRGLIVQFGLQENRKAPSLQDTVGFGYGYEKNIEL